MQKENSTGKNKIKKNEIISILLCYIVTYGLLLILSETNMSAPFDIAVIILCFVFTYKSCKGKLVNSLSFLPLPVFIVIIFFATIIIGIFTGPFHIGKKIGSFFGEKKGDLNKPVAIEKNNEELEDEQIEKLCAELKKANENAKKIR